MINSGKSFLKTLNLPKVANPSTLLPVVKALQKLETQATENEEAIYKSIKNIMLESTTEIALSIASDIGNDVVNAAHNATKEHVDEALKGEMIPRRDLAMVIAAVEGVAAQALKVLNVTPVPEVLTTLVLLGMLIDKVGNAANELLLSVSDGNFTEAVEAAAVNEAKAAVNEAKAAVEEAVKAEAQAAVEEAVKAGAPPELMRLVVAAGLTRAAAIMAAEVKEINKVSGGKKIKSKKIKSKKIKSKKMKKSHKRKHKKTNRRRHKSRKHRYYR